MNWLQAQEHSGENIGTTDSHVLFIELKEPAPRPSDGPAVSAPPAAPDAAESLEPTLQIGRGDGSGGSGPGSGRGVGGDGSGPGPGSGLGSGAGVGGPGIAARGGAARITRRDR